MSCLNYLLEGPGATLTMNPHGMSSATLQYKCNRKQSCNLSGTKLIGPGHVHPRHRWMYCSNVVHTNDGAFDIINATYEGLYMDAYPTGGFTLGTAQQPMATHPNYKQDGREWGVIIGGGNSPNSFGRLLHEDGSFKAFGPLPDGPNQGRPVAAANAGAKELEGVENFLAPGQMVFKYGALHTENRKADMPCKTPAKPKEQMSRLAQQLLPKLGKTLIPISSSIPYIAPPYEGANWLLTAVNEDVKVQNGGNVNFYSTSAEWMASGPLGWNPLLYQDAGAINLP